MFVHWASLFVFLPVLPLALSRIADPTLDLFVVLGVAQVPAEELAPLRARKDSGGA